MNGSPVVRHEDDESVVHHASLLQSLCDVVHGLVHGGDHPALGAPIRVVDVGAEVVLVPLRHLHTYSSHGKRLGYSTHREGRRARCREGSLYLTLHCHHRNDW